MLTPEEHAATVLRDLDHTPYGLAALIAEAIRAAIRADRMSLLALLEQAPDMRAALAMLRDLPPP